MADFDCRVADNTGRVFSHVEAAQSENEVRQKLSDRGLLVFNVSRRGGFAARAVGGDRPRTVRSTDLMVFNQQFNTIVKAGLPILKALDLLAERAAAPRLRPVLLDVRDSVREGATLSEALDKQGMFPKVYVTAVLAGEKSGNLTGVLDYFIEYQKVSEGAKKKLLSALVYPTILIVVASGIVSYLVTSVVPKFSELYSDMGLPLPPATQVLVALTVTYRIYFLIFFLAVLFTIVFVVLWSRTTAGGLAVDKLKLKVPFLGDTWIKFQISQFCRTLATLLQGGTPLVTALATSSDAVTSRLISSGIIEASQRVREGKSLHEALAAGKLMPELGLEMVEVGEASGALASMLASVAEFYEEETSLRLSTLIAVVEPAILVFMALVIAFILISLYLPIFSFSMGAGAGH
jgi:type IV pilus assembly protein PilC